MLNAGESVIVLGHQPEQLWPKGSFFAGRQSVLPQSISGNLVSYCNIPLLRRWSLKRRYLYEFKQLFKKHGPPKCIVSYNLPAHSIYIGLYAQRHLNVPWIPIVADVPDNKAELIMHNQALHEATGRVFLSWGAWKNCTDVLKLHLDGGVEKVRDHSIASCGLPPIILFSGAMNKWAGVELLLQAFSQIVRRDVKLWLCGKGATNAVLKAIDADKRITYFGCVSDEKLEELTNQSTIMVNPRDTSLPENHINFPSKVLEYLSYCKPVISTWTDGLSPEYRDILVIAENPNPDGIAAKIEEVLVWDQSKLSDYSQRVVVFLAAGKTWEIQSQRFIHFLNDIHPTQRA